MPITNENAAYLLGLKKKILLTEQREREGQIRIDQKFPLCLRLNLVASDDEDYTFLWEITQSTKNTLRISLHFQEDDSKTGLFRVDYNSGHVNPEMATEELPEMFRSYVGKWFENDESHVHYHVDGYRSLAWAVPIADTEIKTKQLTPTDFNTTVIRAILEFAKIINVETEIMINPMLL